MGWTAAALLTVSCSSQTTTPPSSASFTTSTLPVVSASGETTSTLAPGAPSTEPPPPLGSVPAPVPGVSPTSDGNWRAQLNLRGNTVIWATTFRPAHAAPDVEVSAAEFDPKLFRAALFNGVKLPGGGPWKNADHVSVAAQPALVAAFNGGFLFKDIKGGYFTEGRVIRRLVDKQATLGIRSDGRLVIGVYGSNMSNDGSWVSLRQNLPPIVVNGKNSTAGYSPLTFGDDFHHVFETFRSALCVRSDGQMMYVVMGRVRVGPLADELVTMGCTFAMQLDVTGTWPQFTWYSGFGSTDRTGYMLDSRMSNPQRYVTVSQKDFIALFDLSSLSPGAVS